MGHIIIKSIDWRLSNGPASALGRSVDCTVVILMRRPLGRVWPDVGGTLEFTCLRSACAETWSMAFAGGHSPVLPFHKLAAIDFQPFLPLPYLLGDKWPALVAVTAPFHLIFSPSANTI